MKISHKKLKNGMTVIHEQRDFPLVSLAITNKFGASFEKSKIKGIAHFIEHLVFTGTETRTHEQISGEIEKKGGILNAFTSQDVTSFLFKLPSEHIFIGLDILSDILNNPTFDEKKFEKEKKVILEEIKMYHDIPQRHIFEKIESNLYLPPFGEGIIGSKESVSEMNRNQVFEQFKKSYNPSNYFVTLVGKADFKKVCNYLEEKFKSNSSEIQPVEIKKHNKKTVEERQGINQAHYVFAFHAPLLKEKAHTILEVLDAHIANGMSSQLFLKIREERGLAYAIKSNLNTEKNYSYYSIYVGTTKESIPEVETLILEGFKEIKNMTEIQLQNAKELLKGSRKISAESSTSVMQELIFAELSNMVDDYYTHDDKIDAVTLDEVKEYTKNITQNYSTAAIVPKESI